MKLIVLKMNIRELSRNCCGFRVSIVYELFHRRGWGGFKHAIIA